MRVLLVEGSTQRAAAISADLKADAIRVELADSGENTLYLMQEREFDLVLLDLALPDMDGSSLISQIRSAKHTMPIIALLDVTQARLKALTVSADDVFERNIDRAELVARIRAVVRRSRGFSPLLLQVGNLTLHVAEHEVTANGVRVHFTIKEFAVLQLLVLHRNMILTKETMISQLYGDTAEPEIKIIDVFICKIRGKLAKAGLPTVISTVWGRGYTVRDIRSEEEPTTSRRISKQIKGIFA